jgi:RNA recognition motif-containing protein
MYVRGLPQEATEASVTEMFSDFGTVRSVKLATDVFTGRCRGFGFVEMEGHEARAAIQGLDGRDFGGRPLSVRFDEPRGRGRRR